MNKLIVIFLLTLPALADSRLQDALKNQYEKHILILRTPLQTGDQEFDSSGKALKDPPANKWWAYGPLLITRVRLEANKLRLEGVRVVSIKDLKPYKGSLLQSGKTVTIKILLDHPLDSADEARALLDRIFFPDPKATPYPVPEFHRPGDNAGGPIPQKIGLKGVQAPRPIFQPDPDYSDKAREAKYQGSLALLLVIDPTGQVSRIKLVKPLGMGLDEKAVEKVGTWKFEPATLNGQPVAIEVTVEVTFNLY